MHIFRKKVWIFLILFFSLLVILALTLPLQSNVNETVRFPTISNALFRQLMNDTTWHKWWPGTVGVVNQKLTFEQGEIKYTVERVRSNAFELKVSSNSQIANVVLRLMPEAKGDVTLTLATSISLPSNPIDRINAL